MSPRFDVLVYGTVCLDTIWRVESLPPPGGWAEVQEEKRLVGGEAGSTAIALSRWGLKVALVGNALGDDADGQWMRAEFALHAPDLDISGVAVLPRVRTPYCVCIATPDGQRTMFGSGPDVENAPILDLNIAQLGRWFTLDPNQWQAGIVATETAAQAGCKILAMDYTRSERMNALADLIVTSHEAVGRNAAFAEWMGFASGLRDDCGKTVIVTCGDRGCVIAEAESIGQAAFHLPAYVAPEVVDTTGAGDVFRAGLLYGQIQDWSLLRSARFASAAAALNCGAMGGWGGVRSVAEIEAFMAEAPSAS